MDNQKAREILTLYRPGTTDAADPQVAEALDLAKRDPDLAAWLEQHSAMHAAIRAKIKSVPVPADLKRKIIVERPPEPRAVSMSGVGWWLAAAAAIAVAGVFTWNSLNVPNENSFAYYRSRMASRVQRGYFMDKQATNQTELRDYFASKNAPVDYTLPKSVEQLASDGGAVFTFNNHPVELLCLRDQAVSAPTNEVWVFLIKKSNLLDAPKSGKPDYLDVSGLMTMSWTSGDTLYLVAGRSGRKDLQKYLE